MTWEPGLSAALSPPAGTTAARLGVPEGFAAGAVGEFKAGAGGVAGFVDSTDRDDAKELVFSATENFGHRKPITAASGNAIMLATIIVVRNFM